MAREEAVPKNKKNSPVIVTVALLAFGLIIGGFGLHKYNIGKKNVFWPAVKGKMTHSRAVSTKVNKNQKYRLSVRYTYTVKGKAYSGDRITASDGYESTRSKAENILRNYPVGGEVSVFYSPSDPGYSVLKTGAHKNAYMLLGVGAICFLFAMVIIISELKKKILG